VRSESLLLSLLSSGSSWCCPVLPHFDDVAIDDSPRTGHEAAAVADGFDVDSTMREETATRTPERGFAAQLFAPHCSSMVFSSRRSCPLVVSASSDPPPLCTDDIGVKDVLVPLVRLRFLDFLRSLDRPRLLGHSSGFIYSAHFSEKCRTFASLILQGHNNEGLLSRNKKGRGTANGYGRSFDRGVEAVG
jgi:hypothetical protein